MSSFNFYRWNQLNVIPLQPVHSGHKATPKVFCVGRDITARYIVISHDVGLNGRGLMTSLGEGKVRSFNKITANCVKHDPVCRYFTE